MNKQKVMNRRIFCASLLASGAARAANPIIDLTAQSIPLISVKPKQPVLTLSQNKFFDIEPKHEETVDRLFAPVATKALHRSRISLTLKNIHTGEQLNLSVPKTLKISHVDIEKFNHICRDWRRNKILNMDPQLIGILAKVCEESSDKDGPVTVELLSGYRTNETNELLRQKSDLVAKNSLHIRGKAIDFRLPSLNLRKVKEKAQAHAGGGLGIYKNFIHIDTGPQRRWIT
jgi:uncharacterized protein YcbK (DUF882 family)